VRNSPQSKVHGPPYLFCRPWTVDRGLFHRLSTVVCGLILLSCSQKDPKFQQYYVQGEQLYLKNCANCHQKNGKGLGLVYPPLDQSDFVDKNFEEVICMMKYGKSGEMIVNEKNFNHPMPGISTLTDLEAAEIATYIYNTWSRERGLINVKQTEKIIRDCAQ
jgi:cytochrome c551